LQASDGGNTDHPAGSTPGVVWIASFPKSGNTWLRFLLARLLFGPLDSSAELDRRIPDVHAGTPNTQPPSYRGRVFVKTHWMFDVAPMRRRRTAAAIYLLRDPRDMFVSLMRYTKATTPSDRDRLLASFVECGGSMPLFLQFGFGSWTQHVESWLVRAAARIPVHTVRYENMLARPKSELRGLARALGLDVADAVLEACIEDTRIERLREIERRDAHSAAGCLGRLARSRGEGFTFFPNGRAGAHRDLLFAHERSLLDSQFEPWLSRLGYGSAVSARAGPLPEARAIPATGTILPTGARRP